MKTLYITRGNNIVIDAENKVCDRLESARQGIDYIYLASEPMHVVYGCGDVKEEADCDTNDIIVSFYDKVFKHRLIVVKSSEWAENINEYVKEQQAEKERWAQAKAGCNASAEEKSEHKISKYYE